MAFRDLMITLLILGSIPYILKRPWIGIIMWTWLAFMSPHRLCWGFAYGKPFSMIIGMATLASLIMYTGPKKMLWTRETVLMAIFLLWMLVTTFFSHYPYDAWPHFEKLFKIFLMVAVTVVLMQDPKRLHLMVAVIAMSIGFYGIKGGTFTITSGGSDMVMGPRGSFMSTHGEIGMAMAMALPYLRYCQLHLTNVALLPKELRRFMPKHLRPWIRKGFLLAMFLTGLAILGTHSRGAMLSAIMISIFFVWKSRQKFVMLGLIVIAVPIMLTFMGDNWFQRMGTISTEERTMDRSSSQRLNSWGMAVNMANHELTGGGYNSFRAWEFAVYGPKPVVADAHNNFFEVLGEHGWPGLIIYFSLGLMTWLKASKVARRSKNYPSLDWIGDIGRMSQVSLVAYVTSGTFIGLAYFDLFYTIVAIVVLADHIQQREIKKLDATEQTKAGGKKAAVKPKTRQSWKPYAGPQPQPSRRWS